MADLEFENKRQEDVGFNSNFAKELLEFMDDIEIQNLNIEDPEQFHIVSREQANYFIKKIKDAQNEIDEVNKTASVELAKTTERINDWRQKETNKRQRDIDYISTLLEEFARKELEESEGKAKSISLPNGAIGFRKQQPKFDYDDTVVLDNLKKNNLDKFINIVPSINKKELKKEAVIKNDKLYINDVELEGITVTSLEDKFEVK
jgi:phage host-nuclease inhibitor protein Gam